MEIPLYEVPEGAHLRSAELQKTVTEIPLYTVPWGHAPYIRGDAQLRGRAKPYKEYISLWSRGPCTLSPRGRRAAGPRKP